MVLSGTDMDTWRLILKSGQLLEGIARRLATFGMLVLKLAPEGGKFAWACAFPFGCETAPTASVAAVRIRINLFIFSQASENSGSKKHPGHVP
jgi:hypothetical protein